MQDIREGLTERIRSTEDEIACLKTRLTALRSLLADEEKRARVTGSLPLRFPRTAAEENTALQKPISKFLIGELSDGQVHALADLKPKAINAGIIATTDKQGGRRLHFALVGLQQTGFVESLGKGKWRKVQAQTESSA